MKHLWKETLEMDAKLKNLRLRMALIGLCSLTIMFGFTTSSVLAEDDKVNYEDYKKKEAEKQLPPHERPYKAEPPKGGHSNDIKLLEFFFRQRQF